MKIAALISGDYRLFEECFESYRSILEGADIYISTWTSTSVVCPKGKYSYSRNNITEANISDIIFPLTIKNISLEDYNSVHWKNLRYNSAMIHRWQKGIELIKSSNIDYDYILILRPDIYAAGRIYIDWNSFSNKDFKDAWLSRDKHLTDIFVAGTINILNAIPTINEWNRSDIKDWHTMFYTYVSNKGFNISRLNTGTDITIARPGKHQITSFNDAIENFIEWRNSLIVNQVFEYGSRECKNIWTESFYNNIFFKDNPSAVIFDLDGVIVDTGKLHYRALKDTVENLAGVNIDYRENISEKSMLSTKEKAMIIKDYYSFDINTYNKILIGKDLMFDNLIKDLTISENILSLLKYIKSKNIKTAIASNSRHININKILTVLGIKDMFDIIVSAEDVKNRKPAPDILFEVYKKLNLSKEESIRTLFIEDTDEGAEAGYKSPSTTIKINSIDELTVDFISKWIK